MNVPLVSVLIPAYNCEHWVADAIRSAAAQTWPRIEIIVVDDGSEDSTPELARRFEGEAVRVIGQRHEGASSARNTAFRHSHGDYIQWLDADDMIAPDKISRQMDLVMSGLDPRTLLSSSWASFIYCTRRAKFDPNPLWCDLNPEEWLTRKLENNIFMQTATWLVSRSLAEEVGPWDIRLLSDDDGEYFSRLLLASSGVRFVHDSKVYYRALGPSSLSYIGASQDKIQALWISMKLQISYLQSLSNSKRVRLACLQYLRDSLMYFYPEQTEILEEAMQLASGLGLHLPPPDPTWKYAWIVSFFGWARAKIAQHWIRRMRWRASKEFDRLLFRLEDQKMPWFGSTPPRRPNKNVTLNQD